MFCCQLETTDLSILKSVTASYSSYIFTLLAVKSILLSRLQALSLGRTLSSSFWVINYCPLNEHAH